MHGRLPQQSNYTQNPRPLPQLHPLPDQLTGDTSDLLLFWFFSTIAFLHRRSQLIALPHPVFQLGETLNRQFESVCETMFGEVESQAVEALDLPGVFRTRSHSYVRAIQAGCSQDDDCLSVFSMSGPQGSIKGGAGEWCLPPREVATRWEPQSIDSLRLTVPPSTKSDFIQRDASTKEPRSRCEAAWDERIKF